ncbi:MAG TPA: CHAD domain-containing protein [Thermoanaerobaculia bacterium]
MAYAIEPHETIPGAVSRILLEQLDRAAEQLADRAEPAEERVHDARKRFKEIRALLRLTRYAFGEHFAVENVWFRDAARELAAARDAHAVLEALDQLRAWTSDKEERRVISRARRKLAPASEALDLDARIANTLEQLPVARARIATYAPLDNRFAMIGDGLARTYRDGRRAYREALDSPTAERYHDWRKRVKDHWYHAQLLRHVWPPMMKAYRDVLEQLSGALGDHHDLDVVRARIGDDAALLPILDRRREELEDTALSIGRLLYAERPRAFRARMHAWWTAWRQ